MSLVYNFSLEIFKNAPQNMSSAELANFIQKAYEEHKIDYKNTYLQSIDSIIYLYTGIYLYEKINGSSRLYDTNQPENMDGKKEKPNADNEDTKQKKQDIVAEEEDTIEPVKTGLTTDEEYEKLLGYE